MSNSLAIATVTEAFRQLLEEAAMASGVSGATATVGRPGAGKNGGESGHPLLAGVNLFLYQVVPNGAHRNADAPTRRSDGSLRLPTRSAYDLHYLLTFHGAEADLEPQRVMGSVLRALHSQPALTRKRIENVKLSVPVLASSDLEQEIELVKVAILQLNLEELSKLWSAFFHASYSLSVAFQASVVFLDGQEVPSPSLPVRSRNVYVRPFRQPVIEEILSRRPSATLALPKQPIEAGDTLVLLGKLLRGDTTRIRLGGWLVEPTETSDGRIEVPLTSPPFPEHGLRAGAQGVQVVHSMWMGTPESEHAGGESNVEPFVLRPKVTASATPVASHQVGGVWLCTSDVTLTFDPPVGVGQRVVLLLNPWHPSPGTPGRVYRFDAPFMPTTPSDVYLTSIVVRVSDVAAGDYLVRAQVDGAESVLLPGPDPNDPVFELPKVTIA